MSKFVVATFLCFFLASCVIVKDSENVTIKTDSNYKVGL